MGTLSAASFVGPDEEEFELPEECEAHFEFGGRVIPTALHLPWRLEVLSGSLGGGLGGSAKPHLPEARVVGTPLMLEQSFPEDEVTCLYETAGLTGSYATGVPMEITLKEQKLARVRTNKELPFEYPSETKVNGHFAVTSDGETVKAEL